jgi:riboflavin transporter FmnP
MPGQEEKTMSETNSITTNKAKTHYIAVTAVLSAIAFVLQYIEMPVPFMPGFIKFDFSDLPALLGSFALGPGAGVIIQAVKNGVHALNSQSFGVGEISNFILGAVFVGVAGAIYKHHKTKKGAVIGSLVGALAMALVSFPSNLYIVYPVYYNFMPKETIIQAYQLILPSMDSIEKSLLVFNVPFTFIKGMIDVVITFLIYKKVSPILHK